MRPFDPRLAREVRPVRGAIGLTAALAFAAAGLTALQSVLAAQVIAGAFIEDWGWEQLGPRIFWGFAAWCFRALIVSLNDYFSRSYGLRVVADVRGKAVAKLLRTGKSGDLNSGAVFSLLTRGIDGLEIYVARYLPQLVISAIVPLGLGLVIYWLDPLSALIIVITIPLIPLFMSLVGWFTSDHIERHWRQVMAVSGSLADLMSGLPELKVFGRARAQADQIRKLGERQQDATMKVLRLSFLSAFVLELLATLSVAIIAVAIGVRLVNGELPLWSGLAALVLAPEVYAPLRMLGVHFHAAAEGLEAWDQVTQLIDAQLPAGGRLQIGRVHEVKWSDLVVETTTTSIRIPDGSVRAGELVAVVGPSGCGKTTLLDALLGLREISDGEISWNSDSGAESIVSIDVESLYRQVGMVGQSAWLGEGTVREVVTRGLGVAPADDVIRDLLSKLKLSSSLEIPITDRSQGVSVGQRRRYAIARALLRNPAVLLLDEPAASLDFETEQLVIEVVRDYVANGGAAIVVAHRAGFRAAADRVIDFSSRVEFA